MLERFNGRALSQQDHQDLRDVAAIMYGAGAETVRSVLFGTRGQYVLSLTRIDYLCPRYIFHGYAGESQVSETSSRGDRSSGWEAETSDIRRPSLLAICRVCGSGDIAVGLVKQGVVTRFLTVFRWNPIFPLGE